jgi:hypothetical protein
MYQSLEPKIGGNNLREEVEASGVKQISSPAPTIIAGDLK